MRTIIKLLLLACLCCLPVCAQDLKTLQSAATATGNGQSLPIRQTSTPNGAVAQVTGTFSATITWEATVNGTDWVAVTGLNKTTGIEATTATAPGYYTFSIPGADRLRARISSYSSGSVTVEASAAPGFVVRNSGGGGGGGSGDVVGPGSATDNAVARFDSTTGKLLQDSTVTIGDTGNVAGLGTLNTHTLPGGTDTIALLAASQSLLNKKLGSLTSNGFVKTGSGDGTLSVDTTSYVAQTVTVNGKALSGNITLGLASADFANQGTTTTLLHGNAAGNPAFGAVVEADITLADNTTNNFSTTKHGFVPKGTNVGSFLKDDGTWAAVSASPGGSDTQVQFNDSSSFGGDAGLTYNKTTNALTITSGFISVPGAGAGSERFGAAATASGAGSTALGSAATTGSVTSAVAVGDTAATTGNASVAVGHGTSAAAGGVAVGNAANVSASQGIAIGNSSGVTASNGIAMGLSSAALGGIAIGASASQSGSGSLVIGMSATDGGTANSLVLAGYLTNVAGLTKIGTGTSIDGLGTLMYGRVVTAKTSDFTVTSALRHTFYTNTGAVAGVTFTLPTAAAGLQFHFCRDANQTVTIVAGASTTIRVGASVTAAAGNVTLDAVGSCIQLTAISTTQWFGYITGSVSFNVLILIGFRRRRRW